MRQVSLTAILAACACASAQVLAATPEPAPFDMASFTRAQAEGRTIVVESYAGWCMPCRLQAPILDELRRYEPFSAILHFRVGEEAPASVWRQLRLPGYGMLIVFKGRHEVGRGTPTNEADIAMLLRAGL